MATSAPRKALAVPTFSAHYIPHAGFRAAVADFLERERDAVAHAVAESLLGAAGLGDIGQRFPDTVPGLAGADSIALLRHVAPGHHRALLMARSP